MLGSWEQQDGHNKGGDPVSLTKVTRLVVVSTLLRSLLLPKRRQDPAFRQANQSLCVKLFET